MTQNTTEKQSIRNENGLKFKNWLYKWYPEETRAQYYWSMGKFFGYPDCCIRNFVKIVCEYNAPAAWMMLFKYGEDPDYHYVRCDKCRIKDPNLKGER
ncbi:MAG: hypothetical protein ACW98X_24845 [Promethearchaeota archaeon]